MDPKVRNLLEKVKVSATIIANKTGKVATKAADVAGKKATEVVEATKLNLQVFDLNTETEILYKEIGKMVYDTHVGLEINQEDVDNKIQLVDEKLAKIAELKSKLDAFKASNKCPSCGRECDKDDAFCSDCGAQL